MELGPSCDKNFKQQTGPLVSKLTNMGGTTSTRRDAISVTNMGSTLDERMGKIENSVTDVDVRLARMEQAMATDNSETTLVMDFANKISEFQSQIDVVNSKPFSNEGDGSKSVVVGGLQGCASLHSATNWLHDTLKALNMPCPNKSYMEARSFNTYT